MRVSQTEMKETHRRIVEGASRLMRKRGIEATSVNDVMQKAHLTHGGFYRHFDSKDALVSAAIENAFHEVVAGIEECHRVQGEKKGAEQYYERYLSTAHVKHPELGCPIAALSMDVARSSGQVKSVFAEGVGRVVEKLAQGGDGTAEENRIAAIRKLAMAAGAVMMARAVDSETASSILAACKEG